MSRNGPFNGWHPFANHAAASSFDELLRRIPPAAQLGGVSIWLEAPGDS